MRIAVLSLHLPSPVRTKTGGVAYVAHRLANGLADRGHELTVFSTDEAPADATYHVQTLQAEFSSNITANWLQNWRIARRFAAQDYGAFDVIHAHGDDAFLVNAGRPIVRTLHGSALAEAIHAPAWRRKLWYLTFAPREVWEAAKSDATVAVSASTKRYVPFVDRIIPNPVDHSVFHPAENNDRSLSVLFVGTLTGRKRGHLLVNIFLSQVIPAVRNAELWLVAERAVKGPNIVSFDRPDEATLAELYRRAAVFCLPSSYEGFGVPYIEALASGTPVVATPNPGAREVLGDGKWGVLVQPQDLGSSLASLLLDADARQRWSQRGLERSRDFALENIVDAYETLFYDVISRGRA